MGLFSIKTEKKNLTDLQDHAFRIKEKKVDYLEIDGNEMMKEDFNHFLEFLKSKNEKVTAYSSDGRHIILEVERKKAYSGEDIEKEDGYQKTLGTWVYYHPVNLLRNKPKSISDYDEIEL